LYDNKIIISNKVFRCPYFYTAAAVARTSPKRLGYTLIILFHQRLKYCGKVVMSPVNSLELRVI